MRKISAFPSEKYSITHKRVSRKVLQLASQKTVFKKKLKEGITEVFIFASAKNLQIFEYAFWRHLERWKNWPETVGSVRKVG